MVRPAASKSGHVPFHASNVNNNLHIPFATDDRQPVIVHDISILFRYVVCALCWHYCDRNESSPSSQWTLFLTLLIFNKTHSHAYHSFYYVFRHSHASHTRYTHSAIQSNLNEYIINRVCIFRGILWSYESLNELNKKKNWKNNAWITATVTPSTTDGN